MNEYITALYIWHKDNNFEFRYKTLEKNNKEITFKNLKINNLIIKPRVSYINPYIEDSIIIFCDFYTENKNLNIDNRSKLIKYINQNKTNNQILSFEFVININIKNIIDLHEKMNKVIQLLRKCEIIIDEYFFDDFGKINIISAFYDPINFCDDLLLFKYILKREFKNFVITNLNYNYMNSNINNENIANYQNLLSKNKIKYKIINKDNKFIFNLKNINIKNDIYLLVLNLITIFSNN